MTTTTAPQSNKTIKIEVLRRPWYEWVLWAVWVVVLIIFAQTAMASAGELEPRAALINWIIFGVLLLGGGIVWFVRRARLVK